MIFLPDEFAVNSDIRRARNVFSASNTIFVFKEPKKSLQVCYGINRHLFKLLNRNNSMRHCLCTPKRDSNTAVSSRHAISAVTIKGLFFFLASREVLNRSKIDALGNKE